jgi:2-dehydro-3-deoxyphosphooctonate aldolase (KDO 8-P synthase)
MTSYLKDLFATQNYDAGFFLMAGPCVIEDRQLLHTTCGYLAGLCKELNLPLIFKSSYKKANRTSIHSFTGIGDVKALELLQEVSAEFKVPCVTDIHTEQEALLAAKYVDVLQIPAFLCRQTELLIAAASTGKIVNIKKGQFLNAGSMGLAAAKISESGNNKIMLCERGNSFGYNELVVDFRNIPEMQNFGYPVVMDCTHAVQQPNNNSGTTGGTPQHVPTIAKCAIAAGADGLFIETHPNPPSALSDGANMLPLNEMDALIRQLVRLAAAR